MTILLNLVKCYLTFILDFTSEIAEKVLELIPFEMSKPDR